MIPPSPPGEAKRHARYRNSHVSLQDIIDANCQL